MSNILKMDDYKARNDKKIIRIIHDHNDIRVLYSFNEDLDLIFPQRLLFWGLLSDLTTVGILAMNKHLVVVENMFAFGINFSGYTNSNEDYIMDVCPNYIKDSLISEHYFYEKFNKKTFQGKEIVQEVLECSGTHIFYVENNRKGILYPIHSWKLLSDGSILPFITEQKYINSFPLIESEQIVYPYNKKYFYINYELAQQVKNKKIDLSDIYQKLNI